ncbi:hypothetical protein ACROYT_G035582 [Oculina patagonica]
MLILLRGDRAYANYDRKESVNELEKTDEGVAKSSAKKSNEEPVKRDRKAAKNSEKQSERGPGKNDREEAKSNSKKNGERARQNRQRRSEEQLEKERERARQNRQRRSEEQREKKREKDRELKQRIRKEERQRERQRKRENERSGEGDVKQLLCDAEKLHGSEDLQRIASEEGFIISNNQGLGNCMFFALAEQLEIVKGVKISAEELRVNLVKFLKENSNLPNGTHLFRFVDHDRHPTWSDYLESMAKDGTWGDHLMLQAAANYYNTAIRVVSSLGRENESLICPVNPADILPNTSNMNHQQPLVLGYIFELHYVSLLPRQGNIGVN